MAQTDEIIVKFRAEGGQEVEETFKRIGNAGEHVHAKITKAGGALDDLRLKSEARVAHNIGNITNALTSGGSAADVFARSIGAVTESFRGSLLFAGGAATGLALYEGITRAGEAVIQFRSELSDLRRESLLTGDFVGADRVNANLDNTLAKLKDVQLTIKSVDQLVSNKNAPLSGITGSILQSVSRFITGKGKQEEKELQEDAKKFLDQLADKQKRVNEYIQEGISGDERSAALKKEENDHLERAAALSERAAKANLSRVETDRLLSGESKLYLERQQIINRTFDLEQLQIGHAKELLDIEHAGLNADQQKLSTLLKEVEYRERLLDLAKSDQDKAIASVNLQRARQQLPAELQIQPQISEQNEIVFQGGRVAQRQRAAIAAERFRRNTQEGRTEEYYKQFGQRTRDYYQNIEDQWDIYDLNMAGKLNRPQPIEPGTNVNTGDKIIPEMEKLIQTLLELPGKIGVTT